VVWKADSPPILASLPLPQKPGVLKLITYSARIAIYLGKLNTMIKPLDVELAKLEAQKAEINELLRLHPKLSAKGASLPESYA